MLLHMQVPAQVYARPKPCHRQDHGSIPWAVCGQTVHAQEACEVGIKLFSMADSRNGYLLNTLIYTGAETLENATYSNTSLPQPAQVVMHLLERYLHKGYHLFTDRYYTSVPLAQALQHAQTTFTGTAQRDRVDLPDGI